MSWRAKRLTDEVKAYDPDLSVRYFDEGKYLAVYRRKNYWVSFRMPDGSLLHSSMLVHDLVLPLTDTWTVTGHSVDWGIEPLMSKLKETDGWRDDGDYARFCRQRDRNKELKDRAFRNEVKARAYDLRHDFARATNDINTSSLERVEGRRMKDGYCR